MYIDKYQIRYVCRKISNTSCMQKHIQHVMYVETYPTRYVCRKQKNIKYVKYVETY